MEALKEKDEETMQELEEDSGKLQERVEKIKKDLEGMAPNYAAEKERMEANIHQRPLPPPPPRTPTPHITSHVISYVQALFHLATHDS